MPREENNDTHQTIPTPNPRERALTVSVKEEVFAQQDDLLPPEGTTTYGEFDRMLFGQDYRRVYEDYIYTGQIDNGRDGSATLTFAKYKSEEDKKTPFRRTWKKNGNHRWPPLLKNYILLEDSAMPRSANFITNGESGMVTGPSFYDRYVYIPDVNEGTRFLLEEYFSPTAFIIPRYRAPVPTGVQISVAGLNSQFPEALHDDIEIPPTRTANATFYGGSAYSGNGSVEGQFFPKTNFKTWLPYVLFCEQEQQSGGWYMQRIRVFPPLRPKAIRK